MKVLTVGRIIFIYVCSYNIAATAGIGETCTENSNCTEIGQVCSVDTCACHTENYYSTVESKCVKELGRPCSDLSQCNDAAVICDSQKKVCKCNTATHYDNNGVSTMGGACSARHALGVNCTNPADGAGNDQCLTANAVCKADTGSSNPTTYSCQCGDESVQDGTSCLTERDLGQTCSDVSQCSDTNTICSSTCQCTDGYYNTTGAGDTGGQCNPKKTLGGVCTSTEQCSTANAECPGTGTRTCSCLSDYYQTVGNTCEKRNIGETCTDSSQCVAQHVQCSGGGEMKCSCQAGYYPASNNCKKRYLGESCSEDSHCSPVNNGECRNSKCLCQSGFYQSGSGSTGTCSKRYLGESCSEDSHCSPVNNSECRNSKCLCLPGYYQSGSGSTGTCSKRYLTESCTATSQCLVTNGECKNSKCLCQSGYYQTGSGSTGTCTKQYLDQSCTATSQCLVTSGECKNSKCSCQSEYYKTGSGSTGTCTKRQLGETCTALSQCSAGNAVCIGTCQCQSGYYDSDGSGIGGSCNLKASVGGSCPLPSASVPDSATCFDNNARCKESENSYTCQCSSKYYDNMKSSDRKCIFRKALSDACSTPIYNFDQCSDPSASCRQENNTSPYKCLCDVGYHNESTGCVANKALGESCNKNSQEVECSDPAALCLGSKCTCNYNHYDSNGQHSGGVCSLISNLKVTNVGFTSIQTNQMTVLWSTPVTYKSYISGFTVQWKPESNNSMNGESQNVALSLSTLTLKRGINPGRAYTVTIFSNNNQTQQGSLRNTSVTRYQASKPDITSGIDLSKSDSDAGNYNIQISWASPKGYVSGYKVELLDGTAVLFTKHPSSNSQSFSSDKLKNGFRYNVTIQAKSQFFDGNTIDGEVYMAEFKTDPKLPNPPTGVTCTDVTDSSVSLSWTAPMVPNGDLKRYHIYDTTWQYITSTTGISTEHIIGQLKPGTFYSFRVRTENEKGNSTDLSTDHTCKTRAKMSDPPRSLSISGVRSRGFDISWNKPEDIHSEENYGYILQIKDDQGSCVKEIFFKCSDCIGGLQTSDGRCNSDITEKMEKTKSQLNGSLSYSANLKPDILYSVYVAATNDAGMGYRANMTKTTLEEAPQKPDINLIDEVTAKSVTIRWNIADPRPGKTTYKITLATQKPADERVVSVEGFEKRSFTVSDLEEFWMYQVSVNASTAIGFNISDTKEVTTHPAAPGNVSAFKPIDAPGNNYRQLKIVWKAPEPLERNSIITNYSFRHNTTGTFQTEMFQTEMLNQETDFAHEYSVMVDVVPEEYYSFEVFAINDQNENGSVSYLNKKAVAGVPKNIENTTQTKIIPKEKVKDVQQTQFTVTFVQEFFEQSENGQIRATGLVACVENKCSTSNIKNLSNFNNMDTWQKAAKRTYRITDESWLEEIKAKSAGPNARRKRDVTNLEYTVGSENCASVNTDEYCNGQLEPNTRYMLFAVACTNGGCLISQPYGPFITLAVPDEEDNLPMIIGIVVAVGVVVLIGAVVGFILLKRRKSGPGKMKPVSESDDEDFTTIDPAVAKIQRKRPILLNEIEEYVNKMHKDSNLLFSAEYEDLKTLSPKHACEAADREENRMRNRYINIIPFDHTRVKLSTNGEDDSSDYINANYLPGYSSPREYIGCQGPIPGTIDDFWRMTWEQNVSVVVMLTLCKEGQKIKCEQYWPDEVGEPKQYGDVIVEITSYSNIRTYDYRMFKITNGSTTRVVKHFHFLSWLDFQANVHHDIILDFIEHVRQHVQPPDTSGPMIIHCSAGVGRTGTYIALDHLMQFINEHDFDVNIDIFDLVLKLRENRQHMVQTEQQYVFIHDCVKEIMDRKRRQMENIYENQAFSAQDENIYQNEQSLYENVSQAKSEQNTEL